MVSDTSPAVSVIMPAFNPGNFLFPAVQSILNQSFQNFELIVIDDGSTDGSFDAFSDVVDSRIRVIRNSRNLGLVASRNLGIALARSDLTAMLDSDDIAKPERLQRQVARFEADPELALLGSCADLIDAEGRIFGSIDLGAYSDSAIRRAIFRANRFVQSAVMFKTGIARQLGGYPEGVHIAEDYALWLQFVAHHRVENLPDRLVQYRVHGQQVSVRKIRSMHETVRRIQQEAWSGAVSAGDAAGALPPAAHSAWSRLTAVPGTLGHEYLIWATRYRRMGDRKAALRTALSGMVVSPLSWQLYEVCLPYRLRPAYWKQQLWRR